MDVEFPEPTWFGWKDVNLLRSLGLVVRCRKSGLDGRHYSLLYFSGGDRHPRACRFIRIQ